MAASVFEKYVGSIVFVACHINDPDVTRTLWDEVCPIQGNGTEEKRARNERDATLKSRRMYSTGFVVKADSDRVHILTCAHLLGPSFNGTKPITVSEVKSNFTLYIMCDHREKRHISGLDPTREYVRAYVQEISCGMDVMLLSVSRNALQRYCPEDHGAIPIATAYPEPLKKVFMFSWPPLLHRTAVSGETGHPGRSIASVSCSNPQGYICRIAEVNIHSASGSSGAPLLNEAGEFLTILHGGYGSRLSYFVSFEDMRKTLLHWDCKSCI